MKIIRPENATKEVLIINEQKIEPFDGSECFEVEFIDDKTYKKKGKWDELIDRTIDENKNKIEIVLTKKQHEQWIKNGGEKWLKDLLKKG